MIGCAACVMRAEAMGEYIATVKEALRRDERDGICDPHGTRGSRPEPQERINQMKAYTQEWQLTGSLWSDPFPQELDVYTGGSVLARRPDTGLGMASSEAGEPFPFAGGPSVPGGPSPSPRAILGL